MDDRLLEEENIAEDESEKFVRRSTRQRRPPTIFTYDKVGGQPKFRQQPHVGVVQPIPQVYGYCLSCYTLFEM